MQALRTFGSFSLAVSGIESLQMSNIKMFAVQFAVSCGAECPHGWHRKAQVPNFPGLASCI